MRVPSSGGRLLRLFWISRGLVPPGELDSELGCNAGRERTTGLPSVVLPEDLGKGPAIGADELGALVDAQLLSSERLPGLNGSAVHAGAAYGRATALSRASATWGLADASAKGRISRVKKEKPGPKKVAAGWRGFRGRLRYAIDERQSENPNLSQNDVAERAGIDSGQIAKILSGERAMGVQANTVLLLAEALDVSPVWLMKGVEPSGLSREQPPVRPVPSSRPSRSGSDSR